MNLAEICDNAKKGREYALLGNYDSSVVYYQGVIQQIHKHCQSLRDPALKVRWQQVSPPTPTPTPTTKPLTTVVSQTGTLIGSSVCEQVRQELMEEYEQVKAIMGTLESFKAEKPIDILAPQQEERPQDPAVWPPPTPAEHRFVRRAQVISLGEPNSCVLCK